MDVKDHIRFAQIHRAVTPKDVQGTSGVKFQGKRNLFGLFLWLFQQLIAQVTQSGVPPGLFRLRVHHGSAAVNDGLVLRPHAALVDLLNQGHNKLRLLYNRVLFAVALYHIHGVKTVFAACHQMGHRSLFPPQGFHQCAKFPLWITNQDLVIGIIRVEHEKGDQLFHCKRFSGTGNAQIKGRLVQEIRLVAHDEVVGNGVLPKVNAALILDFLYLKRNEHRQTFGSKGTERIDLARSDGQGCIEAVKLLKFEHRKLAHMLSCHRKHRFCITVELLLGVGGDGHGDDSKHHPLVAGGKVVQKFLAFFALLFHVIGHYRRKVVVGILTALPVGDVGFHTQQTVFHFPNRLVRRNGNHINGQHQVAIKIGKLRHHIVLDITGVVLKEQHPAELIPQFERIAVFHNAVRADIVLEIVTPFRHSRQVKMELRLLALAVEIMQDAQAF